MIIKYRKNAPKNIQEADIDTLSSLCAFAKDKMGDISLSEDNDEFYWVYNYSETTESRAFAKDDYLIDAVLALFDGQDEYILVETMNN
jgi:hypothetical protein